MIPFESIWYCWDWNISHCIILYIHCNPSGYGWDYLYIYIYIHTVCPQISVCTKIIQYTYILIHTHTYTCIHRCIHTCKHTCIHKCIHTCIHIIVLYIPVLAPYSPSSGTFLWYTFVAIVSILLNLIPRGLIMSLGPALTLETCIRSMGYGNSSWKYYPLDPSSKLTVCHWTWP